MMKHPMQPIYEDANGTHRFKPNAIVQYLIENPLQEVDMNQLACMDFDQDDRIQFAQLIGYSLYGFGELSYVTDDAYGTACEMTKAELSEKDARIKHLEEVLAVVREQMRFIVPALFKIHPDDLEE